MCPVGIQVSGRRPNPRNLDLKPKTWSLMAEAELKIRIFLDSLTQRLMFHRPAISFLKGGDGNKLERTIVGIYK